ncbi:hypothetical protein WG908_12945 [Sphingobium sp. AN641]|uniref:hypothetical protein n=1 Tax=Sphingobium sp. AN641 TaxID=3133443 RepID=UPI0030C4C7DA
MQGLLLALGAIVCFAGAGLLWLDSILGVGTCETSIFSSNHSPDGTVAARIQMTDCGATTGYSRVVMLESGRFWKSECRALALDGEPNVIMEWLSDDVLKIVHFAAKADIIGAENVCFGRKIELVQG